MSRSSFHLPASSDFSAPHPSELGAHLLRLLDHASLQHVLGTLGVDESVGGVQSLRLIHPLSGLFDVPSVLRQKETVKHQQQGRSSSSPRLQSYLINLSFDQEELNERRRALDGSVDVF